MRIEERKKEEKRREEKGIFKVVGVCLAKARYSKVR